MMSEEAENVNTSEMLDFQGEESMKASGDADSTIKDIPANDGNEETDKTSNANKEQESAEVTGDNNANKEDGNTNVAVDNPDNKGEGETDKTNNANKEYGGTDVTGDNADSKGEIDKSNNAKKTENESQEEEYMDILGNKTLLKKVIEPGSGENPKMGEKVTIDVQKTMPELDKQLPAEQITFTLGDCDVEQALDLAVSLMKLGEKATIISGYKYMYGEIGLAPDIPAFANFKLDVHLLTNHGFPNFGKLDLQERILEAKKKKDRGNFYFRRKDFSQAVYVYTKASKIVDPNEGCVYPDASPEKLQELLEFRGVILTNTSIAQLKIGAIDAAIKSATEATKLCPSYSKAYFRLGQAYEQKGSIDEAIKAHKAALKNDPENSKIIHNELSRLTKINKEAKQSQKEMYSKMFWGSNPPDMAKKSNIKEGPSLTHMHAAFNTIPSDPNLSIPPWLNPQLLMNNPMFEAGVKAGKESLATDADLETTLKEAMNFVEKMSNGEIRDPNKLMQMAGCIQSVIPSDLDAYMRNHFEKKMQNLTSAEVADTQEHLLKSFPGLLKNVLKEPAKQPTDGMNDQLDQVIGLDLDQSDVKVPAHAVGVQFANVDQKADGLVYLGGEGKDGNHCIVNATGRRNSSRVGNLDVSEGLYISSHKWSLDAINKRFRDLYQPKEFAAMAKKRMNHLNHRLPKQGENDSLSEVSKEMVESPKESNGANNGMSFGVKDKVPPAAYNQHEVPANLEGQATGGHSTVEMGHQLHSCIANTALDTLMAFDTSPTIQSVFGHKNSEYDEYAPHRHNAHTLHRSISLTNPSRKTVPLYDVRKSFSTANIHYFRNGLVGENGVRILEPSEISLCHDMFEDMTSSSSGFLSDNDRYATLIQAVDNTSLNKRFKTGSTERIDSDFAAAFQQKPCNCSFKLAEVTRFLLKIDNLKNQRNANAFNVPRQEMDCNEGILSDTEKDLDDSLTASSSLSMESLDTILMNEENTKALGPIIDDLQEEDKRWYSDLRTCSNSEKQLEEDTKIVLGCDPHQEDTKIVFGCDPLQEDTKIVFGCDPLQEDTKIVVGCDPHQENTKIVFGFDPPQEDTKIVFGCDPLQEDTKIVVGCDPPQEDTKIVLGCDPNKEDTKIVFGCDPPQKDTKIVFGCDPHQEDTKIVVGCDPLQEDTQILLGCDPNKEDTKIVLGCDPNKEDTKIVFGCDPPQEDTKIVFGCDPHQEDTKIVVGCDPHQEDTKIVVGCDPHQEDTKIVFSCDPHEEDTKIVFGCDPHQEDTKIVVGCDPLQEDTKIVFGFDPHLDEFSCRIRACILYQDIIEDLEKILTTGGNVKEWLGMCKLLKQNERFRSDPSHKSDTNTKARGHEDKEVKACGDEIKKVPTETQNVATPVIDISSTKEVRKSHAHKKIKRHQLIRHDNQPCSVETWKEIEDEDEDFCPIHDVVQPSLSFERKKPITSQKSDIKMDFQDHMKIWQDVIYDITRRSSQTDSFDKTKNPLLDERVRSDMAKIEYKKLMKNRYLGVLEELVRKHGPTIKNETERAMVPYQPYMTSDHCCYRVNKYLKSVKATQERMKQWQEVIYEVHRKSGDTGPVDVPDMAVDNQLLEERIRDDMMKAEKRKRSKTQHRDVLQELLTKYNKIKDKMANCEAERNLKSKQLFHTRENHCEEVNTPLEIQEREDVSKCNMEMERPMTNNEPKGMLSSEQLLQTTETDFKKESVPLEIQEREEERKFEPEMESTTTNIQLGHTLTLEQLSKTSENHCHYVSPISMEAQERENERIRRLETELYQKRAKRFSSWESDVDTGYAYPIDLDPERLLVHMQTQLYQKRARRFRSWESDVDSGYPHEWLLDVDPQHLIVHMDLCDDQLDDMYSWLKNPLLLGTIGAGVAGAVSFGLYRFYNSH